MQHRAQGLAGVKVREHTPTNREPLFVVVSTQREPRNQT